MLEVRNRSPFAANLLPGLDTAGVEHVVVVVKGTFTVTRGAPIAISEEQAPIELADVYGDEPGTSSLTYASDGALRKPGTDVYVVGTAHSPRGKSPYVDVGLGVGSFIRKSFRVFGDRIWRRSLGVWLATAPEPFTALPIVWERAFGGRDQAGKDPARPKVDRRNPVGTGFGATEGSRLPNLEDLRALIRSPGSRPEPMGLGAIAPHWEARARWAGTMDTRWREERCPLLPLDFDYRFMQVAPPDQIVPGNLRGGEQVRLLGCHPQGGFEFSVPAHRVTVSAQIRGVEKKNPAVIDTLLIEPDLDRVVVTWRASVPCGLNYLRTEFVKVEAT